MMQGVGASKALLRISILTIAGYASLEGQGLRSATCDVLRFGILVELLGSELAPVPAAFRPFSDSGNLT